MASSSGAPTEVLRVCVLGAESTGSTTLAHRLAQLYGEPCVEEYAREYSHANPRIADRGWSLSEVRHIADEQTRREDLACERASRLLVCDTDAFTVAVWHQRVLGRSDHYIEQLAESRREGPSAIGLYLLTSPDFPFEHDHIRSDVREQELMHGLFARELEQTGRLWYPVGGTIEQRLESAVMHIATHLGGAAPQAAS